MENTNRLDPEAIETFTLFAVTLKKIHIRLVTEGYTITNDGLTPPIGENKVYAILCKHASRSREQKPSKRHT